MFFAKAGKYEPCGILGKEHGALLMITAFCICLALHYTKNKSKDEVRKIITNVTITLWVMEIIKIIFNLVTGNVSNPGTYVPLYFCSLILYAGLFSSFGKGKLKKVGDVFIATGGMIGGICFLFCPNTSLTIYPSFHYISIQSFVFHGAMVYLGLLVNITKYIELEKRDIIYYLSFMVVMGIIAYIFNVCFDSNLMFVSKNYPNTPVEFVYNLSGKLFPIVMILGQATIPFYAIYETKKVNLNMKLKNQSDINCKINAIESVLNEED